MKSIKISKVSDIAKKVKMYCALYDVSIDTIHVRITGENHSGFIYNQEINSDFKTFTDMFGKTISIRLSKYDFGDIGFSITIESYN